VAKVITMDDICQSAASRLLVILWKLGPGYDLRNEMCVCPEKYFKTILHKEGFLKVLLP
jgi:hypothetical protein